MRRYIKKLIYDISNFNSFQSIKLPAALFWYGHWIVLLDCVHRKRGKRENFNKYTTCLFFHQCNIGGGCIYVPYVSLLDLLQKVS